MKLELKGLKVYRSMSEETLCFEASLCVDGKSAGRVSNRGQGGCNQYDAFKDGEREQLEKAEAWAKTLPKSKWTHPETKEVHEFDVDLDCAIGDMIDAIETVKDVKRVMKKKILFVNAKQQLMTINMLPTQVNIELFKKREPTSIILNALTLDEAVVLYKRHG